MSKNLKGLIEQAGNDLYYHPVFRSVIEDHLDYIRNHQDTKTIVIEDGQAYRYENDWEGLMQAIGVPPQLRWVTLRLNGYHTPLDYNRTHITIIVPHLQAVESLRAIHSSYYL